MIRRLNPYVAGLLMAGSLALAAPAAVHAHPMGFGGGPGQEMRGDMRGGMRFLRALDLTETQRDQAFKIFHDQAPAVRERIKAAHAAGQELRQLALAPSFDAARARQLADTAAKAHADVAVMRAESMSKVIALLTPEQRAKLDQIRERGPRGRR